MLKLLYSLQTLAASYAVVKEELRNISSNNQPYPLIVSDYVTCLFHCLRHLVCVECGDRDNLVKSFCWIDAVRSQKARSEFKVEKGLLLSVT